MKPLRLKNEAIAIVQKAAVPLRAPEAASNRHLETLEQI